jgi:hypothetical protein
MGCGDIWYQRGLDDCTIADVAICNPAFACAVRYSYSVKSRRTKLMDKLEMKTPNLADENFAALAALFPNAVTETVDENGAVVRAIDKDVLAQEINAHVVEGKEERYQFTWPDKKVCPARQRAHCGGVASVPRRKRGLRHDGKPLH